MQRASCRHGGSTSSCAAVAMLVALCICVTIGAPMALGVQPVGLDVSGVTSLLDVMDAIASLHPGFESRALDAESKEERERFQEEARRRNAASETLQAHLDALIQGPTYRLYFDRFSNVTPAQLRGFLLDLPYLARPSPGGMADAYYELLRERHSVRRLLEEFVAALDLQSMQQTALHWVPDGEYESPVVRLIYDANAGSFTAAGSPFFNLYSERWNADAQPDTSIESFAAYARGVMAHEVQHVLAQPILDTRDVVRNGPWQGRWVDKVVRGLVSEGVATHCNPPTGVRRGIWEDREVLAALVRSLEDQFRAMRDETATAAQVETWWRDSFQEMPMGLLRAHFERAFSGAELEAKVRRHASMRPDLEHALGWWMTAQVSGRGTKRDAALELLRSPEELLSRYNAALSDDDAELRVHDDVVAYVEKMLR